MKTIKSFVLAAVLLIAGGAMLFITPGGKISTTKAQTGPQPYESQWRATQLYRVRINSVFNGPAIGVSNWHVDGRVGSGPTISYAEDWAGPLESGFTARNGGLGERPCITNFDSNKWLGGCFPHLQNSGNTNSNVALERVAVGGLGFPVDQNCGASPLFGPSGTSAACFAGGAGSNAPRWHSVYATGAYGFASFAANVIPNDPKGYITRGYMAMPLQWTVTGTITYY